MWIFSKIFKKTVDKIIANEVARKNNIMVAALQEKQYKLIKEEEELDYIHKNKRARIEVLIQEADTQIQELQRIRKNGEEEQKRLWERLDILRDNLNAEQVWIKLWETAYSKAVDVVWKILEKEMLHLAGLAEQRAYLKAKGEFDEDLVRRMESLINSANEKEAIPISKVLALEKVIHERKIQAERTKNSAQLEKYMAQEEIIGELL